LNPKGHQHGKGKSRTHYADSVCDSIPSTATSAYFEYPQQQPLQQYQPAAWHVVAVSVARDALPSLSNFADASIALTRSTPTVRFDMPSLGPAASPSTSRAPSTHIFMMQRGAHLPRGVGATTEVYHFVNGRQVHGMIFDPGAGFGCGGADTLQKYCRASGYTYEIIHTESSSVGGIEGSGTAFTTMRVKVPFSIAGTTAYLELDIIGGSGSNCPFLFPNRTCVTQGSIVHSSYFENRDGLLILPNIPVDGKNEVVGIRLALSDSGHYIIPIRVEPVDPSDEYLFKNYHEVATQLLPRHSADHSASSLPTTATSTRQSSPAAPRHRKHGQTRESHSYYPTTQRSADHNRAPMPRPPGLPLDHRVSHSQGWTP
jgi:hypothetical protein